MSSEFVGLQSDVLEQANTALNVDWDNVYYGAKALDKKLVYPAAHIIPDRIDYVGNGQYEIYFTVMFYYDDIPADSKYIDQLKEVENSLDDILTSLGTLSTIGEYKIIYVDNFVGASGGSIIQGIQLDFKVSKLIDWDEI